MRSVRAHLIGQRIRALTVNCQIGQQDIESSKMSQQKFIENATALSKVCEELGLPVAKLQADNLVSWGGETMIPMFEDPAKFQDLWHQLALSIPPMEGTINHELSLRRILMIEDQDARLFEEPNLFGQAVADEFPEITFDLDEAGKCLALHRSTAAVFHLMRVTEAALVRAAQRISLADTKPSWKVVIDAINKDLKDEAKYKPASMKAQQELFSNMATHLHAIKIAWRNNVMHLEDKYTQDEAMDIFNATKGLMSYLAQNLADAS